MLEEPGSDAAEELLEKDLAAPSLWLLEAGNALWRRAFRGELTQADAVERLTALTKAPVASVPLEQDLPEAMRLALQSDGLLDLGLGRDWRPPLKNRRGSSRNVGRRVEMGCLRIHPVRSPVCVRLLILSGIPWSYPS